jgi:hypothetical protein
MDALRSKASTGLNYLTSCNLLPKIFGLPEEYIQKLASDNIKVGDFMDAKHSKEIKDFMNSEDLDVSEPVIMNSTNLSKNECIIQSDEDYLLEHSKVDEIYYRYYNNYYFVY